MKAACVICGREFEGRNHRAVLCGHQACWLERKRQIAHSCRVRHQENINERLRRVRATNPEKHRDEVKAFVANNRERKREQVRKNYRVKRLKILEQRRERNKENQRKYRAANPEKYRRRARDYRGFISAAKRLGVPPLIYAAMKLADRFNQSQAQSQSQENAP